MGIRMDIITKHPQNGWMAHPNSEGYKVAAKTSLDPLVKIRRLTSWLYLPLA